MPKYALVHYGQPNFTSPEEGGAYQQRWRAWEGGLGEALHTPPVPLKVPQTVTAAGVSDGDDGQNRLTGFMILQAESMETALEMVKGCPHLEFGTIDVSEVMEM